MILMFKNSVFNPEVLAAVYAAQVAKLQAIDYMKYVPQPVLDVLEYMFAPVEGDTYNRSRLTIQVDEATGVTEHQMKQRAGMLVHEIVPLKKESDWVDRFEAYLDIRLGNLIHKP